MLEMIETSQKAHEIGMHGSHHQESYATETLRIKSAHQKVHNNTLLFDFKSKKLKDNHNCLGPIQRKVGMFDIV